MFFRLKIRRRIRRRKLAGKYLKYKEVARGLVRERLEYFNTLYGYKWGRIAIKDHKSRWGSCSKKGNLNFNYRVVLLPPHLADYIVVHELCHLGELNHSPRFWALVERALPDWRARRAELMKVRGARSFEIQ